MELFSVTSSCKACGLCSAACPASLVRQVEPGRPPVALAGREGHCIRCGHCVAVCPTGAFVHALLPPAAFQPLRRRELPDAAAFERLLSARRSCRRYDPTPLPREELASLIASVRHAPTGHNSRQIGYVVIDGPRRMDVARQAVLDWIDLAMTADPDRAAMLHLAGAARAAAKGKDVIFRGAPHAVVVYAPETGVTPETDAVIAGTWLELAASAAGLGACWCGYLMFALAAHPPVGTCLGIPSGQRGYAALLVGRPGIRPVAVPPREVPEIRFF